MEPYNLYNLIFRYANEIVVAPTMNVTSHVPDPTISSGVGCYILAVRSTKFARLRHLPSTSINTHKGDIDTSSKNSR